MVVNDFLKTDHRIWRHVDFGTKQQILEHELDDEDGITFTIQVDITIGTDKEKEGIPNRVV